MTARNLSVAMLSHADAAAFLSLTVDPEFTAQLGLAFPATAKATADLIAVKLGERTAGTGHCSVIRAGTLAVGFCELRELYSDHGATLRFAIAAEHRKHGYATFGVEMTAALAFRNFGLARLSCTVDSTNAAAIRVLEKNGFERKPTPQPLETDASSMQRVAFQLSRDQWLDHANGPRIARLHPVLRTLLDAELAASNEIVETGQGWPEPESVLIKLKHRFRVRRDSLPEGVTYTEPRSPHWWFADYSAGQPPHLITCD